MEDFISKDFAAEVKAVEGERALNVTITTNTVDRSGDIVEPKGAKLANFRKNPVVLMAHDYQGLPIGKASNLEKTENGINAKVTFPEEGMHPLADTIYNMYKQKYMRAWSIGFIPIKSEDIVDDDEKDKKGGCVGCRGRRFLKWELLEFSACPVPNNPDTTTNMITKGINIEPLKEEGFITIIKEEKDEATKLAEKIIKDAAGKEFIELTLGEEVITKPEETDDFIRIPAKGEEGKHKGHKIRWMDVDSKKGIRGIYCIDCKKIITFVFEKAKGWTMAKAKKWMEDHEKMVENYLMNIDWKSELEEIDWDEVRASIEKEEKEDLFTKQIKEMFPDLSVEGLDFIFELITERKKFREKINELEEKFKDIELKAGAVLNAKNKKDLKEVQKINQEATALVQSVLDSAETEEGKEGEGDNDKNSKKDDKIIIIKNDKKEDSGKDETKDKKTITLDEKVITEAVSKAMKYTLGITDK